MPQNSFKQKIFFVHLKFTYEFQFRTVISELLQCHNTLPAFVGISRIYRNIRLSIILPNVGRLMFLLGFLLKWNSYFLILRKLHADNLSRKTAIGPIFDKICRGCARFLEIMQNFREHQILWRLCSVVFHALTLKFPIQTSLSWRLISKFVYVQVKNVIYLGKRAHPSIWQEKK